MYSDELHKIKIKLTSVQNKCVDYVSRICETAMFPFRFLSVFFLCIC